MAVADKVIFVLLFTYFSVRVYDSVLKFQSEKIATITAKANDEMMRYPALTVCVWQDRLHLDSLLKNATDSESENKRAW